MPSDDNSKIQEGSEPSKSAGQITTKALKPPQIIPASRIVTMDSILEDIQTHSGTLGKFWKDVFEDIGRRSPKHAAMVTRLLNGTTTTKMRDLVDLIYNHSDAAPKATRKSNNRDAKDAKRRDAKGMARDGIKEWAIELVEDVVSKEAMIMASKQGGQHLSKDQSHWDFVHTFSFGKVMGTVEEKAPTLLRVLSAAAFKPSKDKESGRQVWTSESYPEHFSKPVPEGSGNNRRDPFVVVSVACMILLSARNLQSSVFQHIIGLFLFANVCAYTIYPVLNRAGFSTSYTTVGNLLRRLTKSSQKSIQAIAKARAFLLIYDNINRMRRAWDPEIGQKDTVLNGTAATMVELEDCDVEKALDPKVLRDSQAKGDRKKLDINVLENRIDFPKLHKVFAQHSLVFLVDAVPSLKHHRKFLDLRFHTTLAEHRMRHGRKTTMHPLQTTDINEGTTGGQRQAIEDLGLRQLGLSEEEIEKALLILGGDQSTVEKIRTLKRFLSDCTHGYSEFRWALPLIQLWHMGWADLERVLNTHWGPESGDTLGDLSTFQAVNELLGRKVKDIARPDYYPAQQLIFDNLQIEVLDCWKVLLDTNDLDAYFSNLDQPAEIEDLLKQADTLVETYMTARAYDTAQAAGNAYAARKFRHGTQWSQIFRAGDQVLANIILRLRDIMAHYEFHHSISGGDIGRALNVMALWTFTFTGSGKSKYSNELLEMACNFEYEYSQELQELIKNNWLVNLSGIEGCWFPMDLMEEKNIKQLKKLAERRDATFGGSYFQDVIAMNVRALLKANESVRDAMRLGRKGGKHKRKAKEDAKRRLSTAMYERQMHKFRLGRTHGYAASDDHITGYELLGRGRIKDFVTRTLLDSAAIHENDSMEHSPFITGQVPLLPTMLINGDLVTAGGDGDSSGSEAESEPEGDNDDEEFELFQQAGGSGSEHSSGDSDGIGSDDEIEQDEEYNS